MHKLARTLTLLIAFPVFAQPLQAGEDDANLVLAQQATAAYGKNLKSALTTAMQAGGPLEAIEVCHLQAPLIAQAVSLAKGVDIYRVSLKSRNPEATPNDWQKTVLESFEDELAQGADPAALNWHENTQDDGKEFRFMKAIPTAPVCLACHGENIAAPVAEKIAGLYPEDKATGYREGQIRGAFVVTRKLD